MPYVIQLANKEVEVVVAIEDFRRLLEKHMGDDAANVFDDILKTVREETEDRIYRELEGANNEKANPAEGH